MSRHKWLDGGIEFVDAVPKNASGKILRRLLRTRARESSAQAGLPVSDIRARL
jgi:4-coumarate--CoA ligase